MTEKTKCQLCGEPVTYPWKYHGYDGNGCPAPPIKKVELDPAGNTKLELTVLERQAIDVLNAFTALPEDVLAQVPTQLLMNAHAVLAMASVRRVGVR